MLKKLTRKLIILSVLVVTVTAVSAAPALAQDERTCWYCECTSSGCYCVQIVCPE